MRLVVEPTAATILILLCCSPGITCGQYTPTPTATPSITPTPTPAVTVNWVTYTPSDSGVDGNHHRPIVIILHVGGYKDGSYHDNFNGAIQDLVAADFKVAVIDWPLAPPHSIQGQHPQDTDPASGRPPQQTNAIEAAIRAA